MSPENGPGDRRNPWSKSRWQKDKRTRHSSIKVLEPMCNALHFTNNSVYLIIVKVLQVLTTSV